MTLLETIELLDAAYVVHLTDPEHAQLWLEAHGPERPKTWLAGPKREITVTIVTSRCWRPADNEIDAHLSVLP